MNEPAQQDSPERYAVVGEDTPGWFTLAFAIVGILVAAAALWLWLTRHPVQSVVRPAPEPAHQSAAVGPPESGTVALPPEQAAQPAPEQAQPPAAAPPAAAAAPGEGNVPEQTTPSAGTAAPELAPAQRAAAAASPETGAVALPPEQAPAAATDRIIRQDVAEREPCPEDVTIQFEFGKAAPIMAAVEAGFHTLVNWLKQHPGVKVSVQGHADAVGPDPYNLLLSYQRADAVAGLLRAAGVPMQAIILGAAGSHEPIEGVPAAARENRRVVVQAINIGDCQPTAR